jgi:membrane protease YdiL (CAAX protease family)
MQEKVDTRRTWLFLLFAFGFTWTIELIIYLTGGLANLGHGIQTGVLLLVAMVGPALANLFTRIVTHEGWQNLFLRPFFKRSWGLWLLAWVGTPLLILLGALIFFALYPGYFDASLSAVQQLIAQRAQATGRTVALSPGVVLLIQMIQAILIAPLINGLATLGEEFGWRGYLLPKLMPLGGRKAMVLIGIIWGVWHWPLILMGYEYGLSYGGAPWPGLLLFVWFTFIVGTYLGWLTLKSKSVWPAVIAHASINGVAAGVLLVTRGQPNPLLGPGVNGLIASLPFAVIALWLLWRSPVIVGQQVADQQPVPGHLPGLSHSK